MARSLVTTIFLVLLSCAILSGCQIASANPINWGAYLPLRLTTSPTYNNTLQGSQVLTFNLFTFANTSLLFHDVFMGAGSPVHVLNVSNSNANLTWYQLSSIGINDLVVNGSGLIPINLIGYGQSPDSVSLINNATVPWSYNSATDTLTITPTGNAEIIWDYPTTSMSMVLGIAIAALLFAMMGIALVMVRWRRRGDDDED